MGTIQEWAAREQRVKGTNAVLLTNGGGPGDATQEGVDKQEGVATSQSRTRKELASGLRACAARGRRTAQAVAAATIQSQGGTR